MDKDFFRILVVDDNPAIHEDFRKILIQEDASSMDELKTALFGEIEKITTPTLDLVCAYQGEEAVQQVKKGLVEEKPFALAFVDMRMPPGWDGLETISNMWDIDPQIQVVICTASSDYSWEKILTRFTNKDNLLFLRKPFDMVEVRQLTYTLTKKWQISQQMRAEITRLLWFRQIVELFPYGIMVCDGTRITYINDTLSKLIAGKSSEIVDKPLADFMEGDLNKYTENNWYKENLKRLDGKMLPVEIMVDTSVLNEVATYLILVREIMEKEL